MRYVKLTVTGANTYTGPWVSIDRFQIFCAGNNSNTGAKSIQENINDSVIVYPNPFIRTINIDFLDNTIVPVAKIRIVDALGRIVLTADRNLQENSIHLQGNFSSGLYLIQLLDANNNVIAVKKAINE